MEDSEAEERREDEAVAEMVGGMDTADRWGSEGGGVVVDSCWLLGGGVWDMAGGPGWSWGLWAGGCKSAGAPVLPGCPGCTSLCRL